MKEKIGKVTGDSLHVVIIGTKWCSRVSKNLSFPSSFSKHFHFFIMVFYFFLFLLPMHIFYQILLEEIESKGIERP